MSKKEKNGTLKFLHKVLNQSMKNGEAQTYEELIAEDSKGITIKLYNKDKNGVEKISIRGSGDKYSMHSVIDGKTSESHMSLNEMLDELKKNKKLKFAAEFLKTQKGNAVLSRLTPSKKGSKKGSKGSKKGSKKAYKKKSKKGSR